MNFESLLNENIERFESSFKFTCYLLLDASELNVIQILNKNVIIFEKLLFVVTAVNKDIIK